MDLSEGWEVASSPPGECASPADAAALAWRSARVPGTAAAAVGADGRDFDTEDWWFRVRVLGLEHVPPWGTVDWDADPDWEFRTAAELPPDELRERYRAACERSRAVVDGFLGGLHRSPTFGSTTDFAEHRNYIPGTTRAASTGGCGRAPTGCT